MIREQSLTRKRVENLLRISEDGLSIEYFNPEHAINFWYNTAVRRFGCGPHSHPEKRKKVGGETSLTISQISLSDMGSDVENEND